MADRCFLVDTDAGEAHCYVSTETLILDEEGNLQTEVLVGQVAVTPLPLKEQPRRGLTFAIADHDHPSAEALRSLGIAPE